MLKWVMVNRLKCISGGIVVLVILVIHSILILQFPKNQLLNDDELNTLITEIGIEPILINPIGNSYTVILYENVHSNETSQLIAYKNRWNKVRTKGLYGFFNSERANIVDVEF